MKSTISEKGQITIPKKLRQQLGLSPGVVLDFTADKGRLIASKKIDQDPAEKWRGKGKLPLGSDSLNYISTLRDR